MAYNRELIEDDPGMKEIRAIREKIARETEGMTPREVDAYIAAGAAKARQQMEEVWTATLRVFADPSIEDIKMIADAIRRSPVPVTWEEMCDQFVKNGYHKP